MVTLTTITTATAAKEKGITTRMGGYALPLTGVVFLGQLILINTNLNLPVSKQAEDGSTWEGNPWVESISQGNPINSSDGQHGGNKQCQCSSDEVDHGDLRSSRAHAHCYRVSGKKG